MGFYDFIAVDFETANTDNSSACSIGMVMVKENKIVDTFHSYIKPRGMIFDDNNIEIHGITPDHVSNSPELPEVWEQINGYFNNELIVAHNAIFDMSVLKMSLMSYIIPLPNFKYLCSISISSKACDGSIGRSLKDRADYFGVKLDNHHDALADAVACANVVLKSIEATRRKSMDSFCKTYCSLPVKTFADLKPQKGFGKKSRFQSIKMSDITHTEDTCDTSSPLYGKSIVFTGEYSKLTRRTAMQMAADIGALVKSGVSKKTDILVVGAQDNSIVGDDGMSNKEEKAYALIEEGYEIKIISEDDFLRMF